MVLIFLVLHHLMVVPYIMNVEGSIIDSWASESDSFWRCMEVLYLSSAFQPSIST